MTDYSLETDIIVSIIGHGPEHADSRYLTFDGLLIHFPRSSYLPQSRENWWIGSINSTTWSAGFFFPFSRICEILQSQELREKYRIDKLLASHK